METELNIKAIIESLLNLKNIPMNEPLFQLEQINTNQLLQLKYKLKKHFGSEIELDSRDTIYTLADKIKHAAV